MDKAIMIEVENLRRASVAGLQEKVSGAVSGRGAIASPRASVSENRLALAGFSRRGAFRACARTGA